MGEEEFQTLYEQMSGRIFSFAARRLSPEVAKDIVAETFEVAWRKRSEWPAEGDARAGWVFTICKNKILQESQRIRRKHHDNRFAEDYSSRAQQEADIADLVSDSLLGHAIYRQLTPSEAELFDVAFMRNVVRAEGAATLGISVIAFNTRISRLRDRIELLQRENQSGGVSR